MPAGKVMSLRVGVYDAFTVGGVKPVQLFGSSGLPMRSTLRWYAHLRWARMSCAKELRVRVYDAFPVAGVKPVPSFGSSGLPMRSTLSWYAHLRVARMSCAKELRVICSAL